MAGTVNKVILIGNLGKDPEIRHLENGITLANFSIATAESFTDKKTGERREITDWHEVVAWRNLGEISEKYLKKGMKIYVEGRLKKRSWQDKDNQTRYITEVVADHFTILSKPEQNQEKKNLPNYSKPEFPINNAPIPNIEDDDHDDLPF